jgi:CRP/FNR family cyclic AMP-dependent transcriptional regulator
MTTAATRAFDPTAWLETAGRGRTTASYRKGKIIFSQGDQAETVYYIRQGKVKLGIVSNAGREAVIAVLGRGDFLGEECLAGGPLHLSAASALVDCSILRIEKAVMKQALRDEPTFASLFVAYLLSRTIRVEADLVDQLFNSSEKRLARMLLLLANFGQDRQPDTVIAKISQETLANMIGTTRSRVSFFMNRFRKQGLITYSKAGSGEIEIHSSLLNVVLRDSFGVVVPAEDRVSSK